MYTISWYGPLHVFSQSIFRSVQINPKFVKLNIPGAKNSRKRRNNANYCWERGFRSVAAVIRQRAFGRYTT